MWFNSLRPSEAYTLQWINHHWSDNGLSPRRRQAIIWINAEKLLIRTIGAKLNEILSEIHTFSFKKMHLKMSSGKWRTFCIGLNVLKCSLVDCCDDTMASIPPMMCHSQFKLEKKKHFALLKPSLQNVSGTTAAFVYVKCVVITGSEL